MMSIEYEFGVPIPGVILPQNQWVKTALKKLPPPPFDGRSIFGRASPVILDIGCGNGRFILGSAVRRPEMDHLGLDILPVVIRYATRRANQRGLSNVRFAVVGGSEFLEQWVVPHSIAEIHIYHPQPFRQAGKTCRRLITPEFLGLIHRALCSNGLWVVQTDNPAYWSYLARAAPSFFDFKVQAEPWPDSPQGRSRREIIARKKGLPIFRGFGRPKMNLDEMTLATLVAGLPQPDFKGLEKNNRSICQE